MRIFLPMAVLLGTLAMAGNVCAQSLDSSGSSGMFGSRNLGSSLSAGQRTFGGSPISGSTANLGNVGQIDSSDRFVRGNRQPGQFVGSSTQDLQNFIGTVQADQRAGQQNRAGPTANRPRSANQPRSAQATRDEIRAHLRIAFPYTKPPPTELGTRLAEQLMKMPQVHSLSPLEVRVAGGTATLRGTVATDHDRDLAARLVRLEAGIWKVNNELLVAQTPNEPAPQTPVPGRPPASSPKRKPADRSPEPPPAKPFLGGFFRAEPSEPSEPKGPVIEAPVGDLPVSLPSEEPLIRPELIPAD